VIFGGSQDGYENVFNVFNGWGWIWVSQNTYGWVSNWGWDDNYNNILLWFGSKNYYCFYTIGCHHCLGCVGLKNKSFCILNKQYTKEERFEKANEIFEQMDRDWTLGKFFPASMNPFYFNDTVAYLIDDSFTKEEVEAEWFLRRDEKIKVDIPEWSEIVKSSELDKYQWWLAKWPDKPPLLKEVPSDREAEDFTRYINPEILKKVIVDGNWDSYRIVKMEYDFLMNHWLPLPELHWLERIKLGFKFK